MLSMLIAYDANGNVVATLDYMVALDDSGTPRGLIDFAAHEEAGGKLRDIWDIQDAVGSGTWPEWIGAQAHEFKVEMDPQTRRIRALVHKESGHRRERAKIHGAIATRIEKAEGKPADIRDLVGGPDRHMLLDSKGKTVRPASTSPRLRGSPTHLPHVRIEHAAKRERGA